MPRIDRFAMLVMVFAGSMAAPTALAQGVAPAARAASASAKPTASAEAGRELFAAHCVRCHGAGAAGTANGPNLLARVNGMSEAGFVSAVLQRYRWSLPATEAAGESAARTAMIRGTLLRQEGAAAMPAWEAQPAVSRGVKDLYEYLRTLAK
jgi:mono/diheme cytochrome c family protein